MAAKRREANGSAPKIKAQWTPESHQLFVTLCLDQVLAGNRPGTYLNKVGWKYVMTEFCKKTGIKYDRKQFKNHWDSTRDQWKTWNKLIRSTDGGGWDPVNQIFNQSDEWWANYLQVHPKAAPFRYKGLAFADSLDTIFSGITATATALTSYTPSQGTLPNSDSDPSSPSPSPETNYAEDDVQIHSQGSPSPSQGFFSSKTPGHRKRSNPESCCSTCRRRIESMFESMDKRLNRFYEVVESKDKATSGPMEHYSIKECVDLLNDMMEIQQGSDLYMFALDVFLKKEYRELFISLGMPNLRLAWLRRQRELARI
ncbi:hypothetical protein QJS10_CPA01g01559 [Acorus calamus]|uniref:Myb/SANT-like domain-containing protein n=1 Tax=Acorus calamus TaxID=4465 RepID=A0AAV9FNJ4_ACOCL|nr:hypothetical protein QJS10_CPA01g01559 [Acorus calamus]